MTWEDIKNSKKKIIEKQKNLSYRCRDATCKGSLIDTRKLDPIVKIALLDLERGTVYM